MTIANVDSREPIGRHKRVFAPWVLLFILLSAVQLHLFGHYFTLTDFWMVAFASLQLAASLFISGSRYYSGRFVVYSGLFLAYLALNALSISHTIDSAGVFKELANDRVEQGRALL